MCNRRLRVTQADASLSPFAHLEQRKYNLVDHGQSNPYPTRISFGIALGQVKGAGLGSMVNGPLDTNYFTLLLW